MGKATLPHTTMRTLGVYGPKSDEAEETAVASYIALSLPDLARHFDCVVVSRREVVDPSCFDYVLYHVSASIHTYHAHIALCKRPGPAIIHEHNCLQLYYELWPLLADENRKRILALFARRFGRTLQDLAEAQALADELPDADRYSIDVGVEALFMEKVTAAITHSPFISDLLRQRYPQTHVEMVNFMVAPFTAAQAVWARSQLGLERNDFLFGVFGRIGEYKRVEQIIRAWQQWHERPPTAKLLILGMRQYDIRIPACNGLIYLDHLPNESDFDAYLGAADCAVQLRHPTLGETSGVVSKLLANNKRLIISDTPYTTHYRRFPNVIQVRPDANEIESLVNVFREMMQLPRLPMIYDPAYSTSACIDRWADIILNHSANRG